MLGVEGIVGYGTAREFGDPSQDGQHLRLHVRQRGVKEANELVLVIPSHAVANELKKWAKLLPPFD